MCQNAIAFIARRELFPRRSFGGDLDVDHAERRDEAVTVTVGVEERLRVQVGGVPGAVGAEHRDPADVRPGVGDRIPAGDAGLTVRGRDEVVDAPAQPVVGGVAQDLLDGIRYPGHGAVVVHQDHHVAHVLREQSELLLGRGDPLCHLDPIGDVTPGEDDGPGPDLGGPDVVVAEVPENLALMGDGVQDHRLAGLRAARVLLQQLGMEDLPADDLFLGEAEVLARGAVDGAVDQVDHPAVLPHGFEKHLRVQRRVAAGPDQRAGLVGGVESCGDDGVVVERPNAPSAAAVGSGLRDDAEMRRRAGECPCRLELGCRVGLHRLQKLCGIAAVERPLRELPCHGCEPRRRRISGVDVQQSRGGLVDGGEIAARVHRDHADVQFVEESPELRKLVVCQRFAGGARKRPARGAFGLVGHLALLADRGKSRWVAVVTIVVRERQTARLRQRKNALKCFLPSGDPSGNGYPDQCAVVVELSDFGSAPELVDEVVEGPVR